VELVSVAVELVGVLLLVEVDVAVLVGVLELVLVSVLVGELLLVEEVVELVVELRHCRVVTWLRTAAPCLSRLVSFGSTPLRLSTALAKFPAALPAALHWPELTAPET